MECLFFLLRDSLALKDYRVVQMGEMFCGMKSAYFLQGIACFEGAGS